nr:hypothetical protein [uncultured Deefgea sp.]
MEKLRAAFNKAQYGLPGVYAAGGLLVLLQFWQQPPDGLANMWIFLYTLPLALLGHWLWPGQFPFMPGGFHVAHTLYFIPAVLLLSAVLCLLVWGLRRWLATIK